MCGIAGIVDLRDKPDQDVVSKQLELLLHRGPDAKAWYAAGDGCIGQTRLSIIDLETGDPPITNEDSSTVVALNGEIYNYRELRDRLSRAGHSFRTQGDTEVIAHAAEGADPAALAAQLDGMFAFAVWDSSIGRLVLGRDRLGKKPLYYWFDGTHLVFASEIKALLADPKVPIRLNEAALWPYLRLGYVPGPETFYEGIRSVPPGHVMVLEGDGSIRLTPYWEPPLPQGPRDLLDISAPEAAAQARALLSAAVRRRLVADVPIGAFLSGGIDSAAVVAFMAQAVEDPVQTFTIGFEDDEGFDERPFARSVAKRFGTDHTEFVVRPEATALVERLVWHYDEPFGDASAIPTYLLSRETRSHVTVALSGDGGDDLFGGYERFAAARALQHYQRLPEPIRGGLHRLAERVPHRRNNSRLRSMKRLVAEGRADVYDAFLNWQGYMTAADRRSLLPQPRGDSELQELWRSTSSADEFARLLHLNLRSYLVDDLLVKVDRMSMAHGLEVRSPFLDRELTEFALRLPARLQIRGLSLKRVLKESVRGLLPDEIVDRRKRGFGVPLDRWFRGELAPYAASLLGARAARVKEHLSAEAVDSLLAEHSGGVDHGEAIWSLVTLEVFLRKCGW